MRSATPEPSGSGHPRSRVRLPLTFDAGALMSEVQALPALEWSTHFNARYHNGGWSGITLRGASSDPARLYIGPSPMHVLAKATDPTSIDRAMRSGIDTPTLAACPRLAAALDAFRCPIRAARLLRLAPGGVIDEHCDPDLAFADGEARVHVALATDPGVEFYVDGERVVMAPGECWYLDLARPHRVHNRGNADRIHLVVDLGVNDWLRAQIAAGDHPLHAATAPSGADEFARFRERVWSDDDLGAKLRAPATDEAFFAATVAEGRAAGFRFDTTDVRAALAAGRREWIAQWLV